jgi:membrane carboxypeptidase/penicillin-binding protein
MKLIKKLFVILLILLVITASILFIIGYSYYSNTLKEEPLLTRVEKITNQEHYTSFDNLSENYINAVIP